MRPTPQLLRFVLGEPGLQQLRAAQSLLALVVFIICGGVQSYEVSRGLVDPVQANALSCLGVVGSLFFFAVIRAGLNRRFESDPSLTFCQCLFGIVAVSLGYAITGPARGAVLGIMGLILAFSMFALPPKRIRQLSLIALGALAAAMAWSTRSDPERYPPEVEVTHLMFTVIIVASIAVLSVRMGALRARLVRQKAELTHALEQNRRLATLDELTGLVNRRHMNARLRAALDGRRSGDASIALALIDIDLFKRINDRHGHAAGDAVLRTFACLAVDRLRAGDCIARWGGEEFLVMMPATALPEAMRTMERLREAFAVLSWPDIDPQLRVTFSAGLSVQADDEPLDAAIERADQCMYAAKASGRNRNCASPLDETPPDPRRSLLFGLSHAS